MSSVTQSRDDLGTILALTGIGVFGAFVVWGGISAGYHWGWDAGAITLIGLGALGFTIGIGAGVALMVGTIRAKCLVDESNSLVEKAKQAFKTAFSDGL